MEDIKNIITSYKTTVTDPIELRLIHLISDLAIFACSKQGVHQLKKVREFPEHKIRDWLNANYIQGHNPNWVNRSDIFKKFRADNFTDKKSLLYDTIPKVFDCYPHKKNGKLGYNKLLSK